MLTEVDMFSPEEPHQNPYKIAVLTSLSRILRPVLHFANPIPDSDVFQLLQFHNRM